MVDARIVANAVLDAAARYGIPLSNLKLQKLLFFVHGQYLIELGEPLVDGEFEAWQHGPVHPLAYSAFRDFGPADITSRAQRLDPVTRHLSPLEAASDPAILMYVDRVVSTLGRLSASNLRALTHKAGGPWQRTVQSASTSANLGMKIKTDVIRQSFAELTVVRAHWEEDDASRGELRENSPYS
jgi:uncharacterized phage-associated protein